MGICLLTNFNFWSDQWTLMEQSLADRGDGETPKLEMCIRWAANDSTPKYASSVWYRGMPWLCGKFLTSERIIGHSWKKVLQTDVWRGTDRHQSWACAFDGQPTTALPNMPLACDMGICLLIMREISNFSTGRCTLLEQSLAYRGDGEEMTDTKVGGVHSTDSRLQPSKVSL